MAFTEYPVMPLSPDIKASRHARVTMIAHRIYPPYDKVFNMMIIQQCQEVPEVGVKFDLNHIPSVDSIQQRSSVRSHFWITTIRIVPFPSAFVIGQAILKFLNSTIQCCTRNLPWSDPRHKGVETESFHDYMSNHLIVKG